MRLRSVPRVASPLVAPLLAGVFLFVLACSGQQEGQQCSKLNGDADCASGLFCTAIAGVNGSRCCPQNRNLSTTTVCGTPMVTNGPDSAAPVTDGSTASDGQTGDGAAEASAPEASTDDDSPADGALGDGATSLDATLNDAAPDAVGPDTDASSADAASE